MRVGPELAVLPVVQLGAGCCGTSSTGATSSPASPSATAHRARTPTCARRWRPRARRSFAPVASGTSRVRSHCGGRRRSKPSDSSRRVARPAPDRFGSSCVPCSRSPRTPAPPGADAALDNAPRADQAHLHRGLARYLGPASSGEGVTRGRYESTSSACDRRGLVRRMRVSGSSSSGACRRRARPADSLRTVQRRAPSRGKSTRRRSSTRSTTAFTATATASCVPISTARRRRRSKT